jgi:ABC-type antimicrobial peptide transport system permease subunit
MLPLHDLYFEAGIKINMEESEATLAFIQEQWEEIFPGFIYDYQFMDDYISELYNEEEKVLVIANFSGIISILIGCLGLYGLVSFLAVQKTKEVGIRKALGASVQNIIIRFSREFMILLTISFALSVPLVWFYMDQWLQSFAYHIEITPLVFIYGYVGSILVAGLTVGYKSYVAASINPVDALKEE